MHSWKSGTEPKQTAHGRRSMGCEQAAGLPSARIDGHGIGEATRPFKCPVIREFHSDNTNLLNFPHGAHRPSSLLSLQTPSFLKDF